MPVPLDAFKARDVFIDYPFEDAKFRFELATGKVFRRFTGQREDEVPWSSELFTQAVLSGREITREQYDEDPVAGR